MQRRTLLKAIAAAPLMTLAAPRAFAAAGDDAVAAALAAGNAPGLGGAVFTADETLFLGVGGVRQAGSDNKIVPEDRWHIGSNTKAMTAAVFQRLVEKGQIKDGATLAELFPGIAVDPALAGLTADDLSAHKAGLEDADVIGRDWLMTARDDSASLKDQRAVLAAKALGMTPSGRVGSFAYANINFIVLGAAIEQATGMAWEDVVRAEMFVPLEMTSSGFGPPSDPAPWGHAMGRPVAPGPAADNPLAMGPAGTVHVSLADYGKWLQVILKGGGWWLSAGSMAAMTAAPAKGEVYRRGWGVIPARDWARGPVLAHEGSNTMWHSVVLVAPVRGIAIATMCNDGLQGADAARELAQALQKIYAA